MLHEIRDSEFRIPDWRWRRAKELKTHARVTDRRYDDEFIGRAIEFMIDKDARRGPSDDWELARKWTTLYKADLLYTEDTLLRRRRELEARLLSHETVEHIAAKMHLGLGIVQWYESLFFNVNCNVRSNAAGSCWHSEPVRW